jgi:Protein of unknown function (DUF3618)
VSGPSSEIEGYNPYLPASRQPMPGPTRERPPVPRTPDAIEAEINVTRNRLASTLSELQYRVRPDTVKRRAQDNAKARLRQFQEESKTRLGQLQKRAKAELTTPSGKPRPEVIAAGAVFVLGIALVIWRRSQSD